MDSCENLKYRYAKELDYRIYYTIFHGTDKEYLEIEADGKRIILAEARLNDLKRFFGNYSVIRKFLGKELEGLEYEHPFQDLIDFAWNRKAGGPSGWAGSSPRVGPIHETLYSSERCSAPFRDVDDRV